MAKSVDEQIRATTAKKVIGQTTESYKSVVLELYKHITANSLQVGIQYGSPVLTGRYDASHTIARGAGSIKPCASRTLTARKASLSRSAPDQCRSLSPEESGGQ